MLKIGSHLSISKGFVNMAYEALDIGANTFQFFTRNPRGAKAKDLNLKEIEKLSKIMEQYNFAPILAHGAYTMNLASNNKKTREFSKELLKDDLKRLSKIPNSMYVFHPGNHVGQGSDLGINYIVEALNEILDENIKIPILLETMSGKGTEIGKNFEEIIKIINNVEYNKNLGVCLDTCHIFSSGYNIVDNLDQVIEEFDEVIGLRRLKAIHLNDSLSDYNSNKDRHAKIGEGKIGLEAIIKIINNKHFKNIPFYLETPNNLEGYKYEISLLRKEYIF